MIRVNPFLCVILMRIRKKISPIIKLNINSFNYYRHEQYILQPRKH